MVPSTVKNEIVALRAPGEILVGVINDSIRADRSHRVHTLRTAYAGYVCAERLGDLHGERTHSSRRTIDQDLLPRLNPPLVAKTLQCGECRHRYRSCLLKRHVLWLAGQCRLGSTSILGKGPTATTEHRV